MSNQPYELDIQKVTGFKNTYEVTVVPIKGATPKVREVVVPEDYDGTNKEYLTEWVGRQVEIHTSRRDYALLASKKRHATRAKQTKLTDDIMKDLSS